MGKMGKKLFNLAAIITSLYRVITVMTLRHRYVIIMSHIQGASNFLGYYVTVFTKIVFLQNQKLDLQKSNFRKMLRNGIT